ncbi:MAG TPA: hypothetical protein VJG83_06535 [archaeon]|nr:hypothetical protein [archaeon]
MQTPRRFHPGLVRIANKLGDMLHRAIFRSSRISLKSKSGAKYNLYYNFTFENIPTLEVLRLSRSFLSFKNPAAISEVLSLLEQKALDMGFVRVRIFPLKKWEKFLIKNKYAPAYHNLSGIKGPVFEKTIVKI